MLYFTVFVLVVHTAVYDAGLSLGLPCAVCFFMCLVHCNNLLELCKSATVNQIISWNMLNWNKSRRSI